MPEPEKLSSSQQIEQEIKEARKRLSQYKFASYYRPPGPGYEKRREYVQELEQWITQAEALLSSTL